MVRGGEGVVLARSAGCVLTGAVPEPRDDPGLVDGDPTGHTVAQPPGDDLGELGEARGRLPPGPSPRVLQRLRQVPVVERHDGLDARTEEIVDVAVVEVEPGLVYAAAPFGEDARPGNREPECVRAEFAQKSDVALIAVVGIARDGAGITVPHGAGNGAEAIPDALASAVLVDCPFDLIRGSGGSPQKISREHEIILGAAHGSNAHPNFSTAAVSAAPDDLQGARSEGSVHIHPCPWRPEPGWHVSRSPRAATEVTRGE